MGNHYLKDYISYRAHNPGLPLPKEPTSALRDDLHGA